jgi:four helix bundle protein
VGTIIALELGVRDSYDTLNARTKKFAVRVILFARALEDIPVVRSLAKQLVAAGTSVAANQRAARRARSNRELAAKLSVVVEEADESAFWCELLQDLPIPSRLRPPLDELTEEAHQLVAIFSKGRATMRRRLDST